jgi:hypothetical protein
LAPPKGFDAHGTPPEMPSVSAVNTRTTPGKASAADVSIDRMLAEACGERTNAACSIPGSLRSST